VRRVRPVEREAPHQGQPAENEAARPRPARTASVWRSWREDGPSSSPAAAAPRETQPAAPPPASEGDPEVVDRFGSVTVRRLGTGRFGEAATSVLASASQPAYDPAHDPAPAPSPTATGDGRDAAPPRDAPNERPERLLGIAPDLQDDAARDDRVEAASVDEPDEAWLLADPEVVPERAEPASPPPPPDGEPGPDADATDEDGSVRQVSLFDAPGSTGRTPARAARAPRRPAERSGSRPAAPARAPTPTPTPAPSEPAAPRASADVAPSDATDADTAQRAREEALSRAGDLRSRIVRWMLAPSTPVIVSIEAVQAAFDLPADVARDIVEGILESPPPSLRLTRLRADLLRLSRITVEQDA
jgi:hypothetical protein